MVYFGIIKSKVKVTSHRNIAGVGLCTLVSAGLFSLSCNHRHCHAKFLEMGQTGGGTERNDVVCDVITVTKQNSK